MPQSAFPQSTELTAIAMAVSNRRMIADLVLPRTSPLGSSKFSYQYYSPEQFFTVPDTRVGRKGRVNEVDFTGKEITSETVDHGLEIGLPQKDIDNAPANTNLMGLTAEMLAGLILLDREIRTAQLMLDPAQYQGNSEVVAATDRFDNPSSNPLDYLLDVLDRPLVRPNTMTLGQREWRSLRTHPAIVKAVHGNSGDAGAASRQAVADLLEISNLYVGEALLNIAKPGQLAQMRSCWAGGVSLAYIDETAARISGQVTGALTFGFTAQCDQRVAGSWFDQNIGLRGGQRVRVGEEVLEVICAPCAGYLLEDVVTP